MSRNPGGVLSRGLLAADPVIDFDAGPRKPDRLKHLVKDDVPVIDQRARCRKLGARRPMRTATECSGSGREEYDGEKNARRVAD